MAPTIMGTRSSLEGLRQTFARTTTGPMPPLGGAGSVIVDCGSLGSPTLRVHRRGRSAAVTAPASAARHVVGLHADLLRVALHDLAPEPRAQLFEARLRLRELRSLHL